MFCHFVNQVSLSMFSLVGPPTILSQRFGAGRKIVSLSNSIKMSTESLKYIVKYFYFRNVSETCHIVIIINSQWSHSINLFLIELDHNEPNLQPYKIEKCTLKRVYGLLLFFIECEFIRQATISCDKYLSKYNLQQPKLLYLG